MKIDKVRIRAVNVPLIKPYTIGTVGTLTHTRSVVVELFSDQGITGIGEADPELMFTGESQHTVMTALKMHIGPAVLGHNPLDLEALHARMDAVCMYNNFAKAAIDLACHDLLARKLQTPLFQLFGGIVHPRIDVIWSLGSDSPEANAAEAVQKVSEGYLSISMKVGTLSPDEDVARVKAVRQAVGDAIQIRCDANQAWSSATALPTIRKMAAYDICMIEQPLPAWDIEGMIRLRSAIEVPLAVDESFCSPRDALMLVKSGAADIFSIKTTKLGGLLPARKAAAIIESAGQTVFINSMIELGISVLSSLSVAVSSPILFRCGHALNSVRRLRDDILTQPIVYDGGQILAPTDRVGLGAELDERKMKKYTVGEIVLP